MPRRKGMNQNGAALLELALILPIVLLLVLFAAGLGIVESKYTSLSLLSRESAKAVFRDCLVASDAQACLEQSFQRLSELAAATEAGSELVVSFYSYGPDPSTGEYHMVRHAIVGTPSNPSATTRYTTEYLKNKYFSTMVFGGTKKFIIGEAFYRPGISSLFEKLHLGIPTTLYETTII